LDLQSRSGDAGVHHPLNLLLKRSDQQLRSFPRGFFSAQAFAHDHAPVGSDAEHFAICRVKGH